MALIDKASLLMVPSVYEDGTLYNVLPSGNKAPDETGNHNGYDQTRADFTFSRGFNLTATRVNANGLIEKGRENVLTYSNDFSQWSKVNSSVTSGQSGYNNLNDAWLLTATSTGPRIQFTVSKTGVNTFSIYAKAGSVNWLRLLVIGTSNYARYFDLENGVKGGSVYSTEVDSEITNIGNGWYRCSITTNVSISEVRVYLADADGTQSTTSSGSIYIQDAQLEAGLVATPYIETGATTATAGVLENTPRIDYSSGAGSLKLEPQRTNLTVHSEYLGASDWAKTRCTIEDNSTTSPEGLINSAKMTSTDANESYIQDIFSFTGSTISWSFFAKKGDLDYCHGLVWDLSANGCRQWFNVNDGTVGGATTFGSGYSVYSATIEDYGSGWYRCTMIVSGSSGSNGCRVSLSSANTIITSAVNSYGYFYGLQAEDSTYSSSLIPTYGSAATRGADSCSVTGVSDVIGQTEGTLYADFIFDGKPTSIDYNIMILGAIGSNYINIGGYNTSLYARVFNSTLQGTINALQMVAGTRYKVAVAYANNDVVMYVNGANEGTDTSASIPAVSQIGFSRPSFEAKTNILNAQVYKERLTNSELATLTTL